MFDSFRGVYTVNTTGSDLERNFEFVGRLAGRIGDAFKECLWDEKCSFENFWRNFTNLNL